MTLLLLSVGVAMDAAAVSGSMAIRGARPVDLLKLALTFGAFQFGMSLAGALGGRVMAEYLSAVDHWIAFALLLFVGGKMIWEARSQAGPAEPRLVLTLATLFTLGVATSIDALAVGVTLPTLQLGAWLTTTVIGLVTVVLSLGGAWAGRLLGTRLGKGLDLLGGVLLIAIGVKTLVEHLAGR
jgi:putative Mn2+ efflux pump MntP